jgi:hypothetical protein
MEKYEAEEWPRKDTKNGKANGLRATHRNALKDTRRHKNGRVKND